MSTEHAAPGPAPEQEDQGLRVLAVLEAMLFASPEPLTAEEIQAGLPDMTRDEIESGLDALARALGRPDRGFRLERVEEPRPSDETVALCPIIQDAQVVSYFLHVRVRKPLIAASPA